VERVLVNLSIFEKSVWISALLTAHRPRGEIVWSFSRIVA
jgi:hypothetical protein